MTSVQISTTRFIAGSGELQGLGMRISNSEASGDAESRRGGSSWDDEE